MKITTSATAKLLGVSPSTVRRMIRAGRLAAEKTTTGYEIEVDVVRAVRIVTVGVEAFVAALPRDEMYESGGITPILDMTAGPTGTYRRPGCDTAAKMFYD